MSSSDFNISSSTVLFCKIFSITSSSLSLCFLLISCSILYKRRNTHQMISFPLQVSIACFLNTTSYLLPYYPPLKSIHFICRIQSLFHILSLLLTLNMLFIYYLLNYLVFSCANVATSHRTRNVIYTINWIFMLAFFILNIREEPCITRLEYCRYYTNRLGPTINTIYSIGIIFLIMVLFILIQCKVEQKIKYADDENLIGNFRNIRMYFLFIVSMILVKIGSYFLKEGKRENVMFVVDRMVENMIVMFLLIFVIIGKKGFKEFWEMIKGKQNYQHQEDEEKKEIMKTIGINSSIDSESLFDEE